MSTDRAAVAREPFAAWSVLAGGFVNAALAAGVTSYSYGLFVGPLQSEYGLSREQAYYGLSLYLVGVILWSPIVGRLLDRWSVRKIVFFGALCTAAGFGVVATTRSLVVAGLSVVALIALGTRCAGALPATTLVARWFTVRRGLAMGILSVSASAGGFAVVPALAAGMTSWGWRDATLTLAAVIAVVGVATALFALRDPPKRGAAVSSEPAEAISVGTLLRTPNFWLIGLGAGIVLGTSQAVLAAVVSYGTDQGLSLQRAAYVVSVITLSAIVGKLVIGWLAERFDKRRLFALTAFLNAALLLFLVLRPDYMWLLVGAGVLGLGIGGTYPVWTMLIADAFGRASYGSAIGGMSLLISVCGLLAVAATGRLYASTGGYEAGFWLFIALDVLAITLVWRVRPRPASAPLAASAS